MHLWGDETFDWNALNSAIRYCMDTWRRWGRIGSHGKEKYGTFRDHVHFYQGYWAIHELVNPGYVAFQWGLRLQQWDLWLGHLFVRKLRLHKIVQWWQAIVYNYAIQQACKRYPHIVDEICHSLDGYSLVKPGIFGPIDGTEIHKKYWTSAEDENELI